MLNKLKKVDFVVRIYTPIGPSLFKAVLHRGDRKFKTTLDSRRGSKIMFLLSSLSLVIIGCICLSPKWERVDTDLVKSILIPSVVRVMWVNA